ncbi:MAG: hypothetical protein M1338_03985 [Patescibacteria group bacterium]|nr:hypothetical protein [Patescibacteria group bacterium]
MEQILLNPNYLSNVFFLTALAFILAILWTPILTNFLYKNKIGKRIREKGLDDKKATYFYKYHKGKENTPTMGGLLIWITAAAITLIFNLDRAETYLPLFVLVACGIIGALDDLMNVFGIGPNKGGMKFSYKFILYTAIAALGAWWFYSKLGWSAIHIPGGNYFDLPFNIELGWWYIPLFIGVCVLTAFSANQTDGLDGLLGGTMMACFGL